MYPILARYGSIFIYSYTVILALGTLSAIAFIRRSSRQNDAPYWFNAFLFTFAAAIIGGRIGFVIWRWDYFQEQPSEAWQIWQGGLTYHPALLAAILALIAWTAAQNKKFYKYAALLTPALLIIPIFGWTACWLEGCASGQETLIGPFSAYLPDEYGVFATRYRTQLLGILFSIIAAVLILWHHQKRNDISLFLSALAAGSLVTFLISLFRGDPTLTIGAFRFDTLVNGLLVIISLLLLQYERRKFKKL